MIISGPFTTSFRVFFGLDSAMRLSWLLNCEYGAQDVAKTDSATGNALLFPGESTPRAITADGRISIRRARL